MIGDLDFPDLVAATEKIKHFAGRKARNYELISVMAKASKKKDRDLVGDESGEPEKAAGEEVSTPAKADDSKADTALDTDATSRPAEPPAPDSLPPVEPEKPVKRKRGRPRKNPESETVPAPSKPVPFLRRRR